MTTPAQALRALADWCDFRAITRDEVVHAGVYYPCSPDVLIEPSALVRLWPGRVFEADDDGHVVFYDGTVRVATVLDDDDWQQYADYFRRLESVGAK